VEKKNYIVGIDIGSSNVVMIVGSKNEAGEIVVDAIVSKPTQGVVAGKIDNINLVSDCSTKEVTERKAMQRKTASSIRRFFSLYMPRLNMKTAIRSGML
jgi:cell division ATPase FtsA